MPGIVSEWLLSRVLKSCRVVDQGFPWGVCSVVVILRLRIFQFHVRTALNINVRGMHGQFSLASQSDMTIFFFETQQSQTDQLFVIYILHSHSVSI